jgi:hypothetical protein
MNQEKPHWNHYFHIQISKPRKWVRWDYVSKGQKAKPLHVQPKRAWLGRPPASSDRGFWYEFKLPEPSCSAVPTVYDEVESWGWRFFAYDSWNVNGEFTLVSGMEEALKLAKQSFKDHGLIPEGIVLIGEDGSEEEIPMDEAMVQFTEQCKSAVESWSSGKGWPAGWSGKPQA